ncbi:uncharacterized protein LOC111628218 [Centruroides sculpturatus]|uniref:uncharacterized protein LOC111628218 n=1 Tax=Centruroides sculpturatus TaxID=218467 RepID=UPI000C6C8ED5|nr:uncharacterized protein LOC111628218 [Centruroides sculpturatus]
METTFVTEELTKETTQSQTAETTLPTDFSTEYGPTTDFTTESSTLNADWTNQTPTTESETGEVIVLTSHTMKEGVTETVVIEIQEQLDHPLASIGHLGDVPTGLVRPRDVTRVIDIIADCFTDHMMIHIKFNGSFRGLIYTTGYSHDPECVYVNGSGQSEYQFMIRHNKCGTLGRREIEDEQPPGNQQVWNTITVQYNHDIEEEWDEHFRVMCQFGYDLWKTVTFPVVNVHVNTGSPVIFTVSPPQCHMEIRHGFGTTGDLISGPVNVGDPLTLLIHMKSDNSDFDMIVSDCFAHNGGQKRLQLTDENGCVLKEKLISSFRGLTRSEGPHFVSLYAYLKAFRFTASPALYLECKVHMCQGSCSNQACHWKNVTKRSLYERLVTKSPEPIIAENVSLFQALEVRQDTKETSKTHEEHLNDIPKNDLFCLKTGGFAAIFSVLLTLLTTTTVTTICLGIRVRKVKSIETVPSVVSYNSTRPSIKML